MIGAFVSNLFLLDIPSFRLLFFAQLLFYAGSALAASLPPSIRILKPLRLATMFTAMNLALFAGFWKWLLWRQNGTWTRTGRGVAVMPVGPES
jgi:hypothetical protein